MDTGIFLIADPFHPSLMEILDSISVPYNYQPEIDREGIRKELESGISGLIIRSKTAVDRDLLTSQTNLKIIARGGAGLDNIDSEYAQSLGIACVNAGNANSNAVAEHTLGMLLSLLHKINSADAQIRSGFWDRDGNRGTELSGKTIGIIGYGNAGSAVAKILSGFDVKILAYDKYKKNFGNDRVVESEMAQIFEQADIVTLHLPLDRHTNLMVNSDFVQSFVRKIILLNTSRGSIVSTRDVLENLKSGKLLAFGADVLEVEDPQRIKLFEPEWFNGLIKMNNVILTPHVAGWTSESYRKISENLGGEISRIMSGDKEK